MPEGLNNRSKDGPADAGRMKISQPSLTNEPLAQGVARMISPQWFMDVKPFEVAQPKVLGKPEAYSRRRNSEILKAKETAREVVEFSWRAGSKRSSTRQF